MRQHFTAFAACAAMIALVPVSAPGRPTQQSGQSRGAQCKAVFDANKAAIDKLATARDSAGIRALMARNGCPAEQVAVPEASRAKAAGYIDCEVISAWPLHIRCTLKSVTSQGSDKR